MWVLCFLIGLALTIFPWFYLDDGGFCPVEGNFPVVDNVNLLPLFLFASGCVHAVAAVAKFIDLAMMSRSFWERHPKTVLAYKIVFNTSLTLAAIALAVWIGFGSYWTIL